MTPSTYYGIVYHGGINKGLGSYGRTKSYKSRQSAELASARLAAQCVKIVGGSPFYEVFRSFTEDTTFQGEDTK